MNPKRYLTCALLVMSLTACGNDTTESTEAKLRPVRVFTVAGNDATRQRSFTGISQSTQESRLSFKVGGTVVALPVQVGDQLRAGDLIAGLNRATYDLQVQQAEASLAQAQANQRNSDANYARIKGLYVNNNASRNELDTARANAESAEAQVRSARKSLEIAQLDRSYTRLTATTDCTVASLDIEVNENISSGQQIARVNCGTGIEVSLGIPESLIAGFKQGMPATIRFNALQGRQFAGQVTEVGFSSGGNVSTFPVVVALSEFDDALRPGMAAEVSLEFEATRTSGHIVPASAIVNDERGTFVYVAEPTTGNQATIRRRDIEYGELTESGVAVTSGLSRGDRVVTAGTSVIREAQIVLLPQG